MPRLGTRKLYYLLQQQQPELARGIGRDWLFRFLQQQGLLVRKKKKYMRTTDSGGWTRQYPDHVKNNKPCQPEQHWVADITYLATRKGYRFLHLLSDAYSKKIVGYKLSTDMSAASTLQALQAALAGRSYDRPIIHHSDRGLQYRSSVYTNLLKQSGMTISMTQDGSPYDNAVAERINGILKQEYGLGEQIRDDKTLAVTVKQAINSYNYQRPHLSCWMLTPHQMHQQSSLPLRTWKKTYKNAKINV